MTYPTAGAEFFSPLVPAQPDLPDLSGTWAKPSGMVLSVSLDQQSPRTYRVQGRVDGRLVRAGLYRHDALASLLRNAVRMGTPTED
jgi:hypothetical protein